jgi:hypothetical protein
MGVIIIAKIIIPKEQTPTNISNFLGINEGNDGNLGLKLGEASNMLNFRVTKNYKLKQREGYRTICNFNSNKINGMTYYHGKMIVASGGNIYEMEVE